MSLNIKNEETHRLAHELADRTGESLTTAVTVALQERLEHLRHRKDGLSKRLLEMCKDGATRLPEPYRSADHADLLYDERGLPK